MGARGESQARLRSLPAVHEVAAALAGPRAVAIQAARRAVEEHRQAVRTGTPPPADSVEERAQELLAELEGPSLRRVINATGVVLHTNLGRAPLALPARRALSDVAGGYSNLELELDGGRRGSRQAHVERLLCELTGADAALVCNNGAAAVLLAVAALAGGERCVIVSRGQLVEIGGGFRIHEVIAQCGARLVEVGTTNRTRLDDYARAIEDRGDQVGAVLRVHQSNFRTVGFVEEVPVEALCGLGAPVIDDLGSGALADRAVVPALLDEPSLSDSVAAGAALVCCSGDKLLGGPQAGLTVGSAAAVRAARRHPLARALRIDKLSLAALEATLRLYLDPARARREIPVLAMLTVSEEELTLRARRLLAEIGQGELVPGVAKVGGGALPLLELQGPVLALPSEQPESLGAALRAGAPAVVARIHDGRLVLDPRTIADDELGAVADAVRAALGK